MVVGVVVVVVVVVVVSVVLVEGGGVVVVVAVVVVVVGRVVVVGEDNLVDVRVEVGDVMVAVVVVRGTTVDLDMADELSVDNRAVGGADTVLLTSLVACSLGLEDDIITGSKRSTPSKTTVTNLPFVHSYSSKTSSQIEAKQTRD